MMRTIGSEMQELWHQVYNGKRWMRTFSEYFSEPISFVADAASLLTGLGPFMLG